MNYNEQSLIEHKNHQGKVGIVSRVPLETRDDLSTYYSPGVAAPCLEIAADPAKAYDYTWKSRTIAVVSDGTAVLGLGNIGGLAGLPVMEGKAVLLKGFADVDAIPIVLKTQDPQDIISIVENIAPTFGGINLEDIAAPNCFVVEEALKERLDIPVFHDDQHGTAIVVLAGLINAAKVVNKELTSLRVVIAGAGAAGIAIAKLLIKAGITDIMMTDRHGILTPGNNGDNKYKEEISHYNTRGLSGDLSTALEHADVFIGVAQAGIVSQEDVRKMAGAPIIFALSNPVPEIMPEDAKAAGAAIVATGRSDYPNQINNVLVFPGIFRGALDHRVAQITDEHKLAAAYVIADYVQEIGPDSIVPSALDKNVAKVVAEVIR
ncbi:MAG: NADP-dependent malic enzyme [Candidatus Peribacteria bacterium]|nr:MAG: NADP-dependent malic enzyme [Candidatus Peribacteria bacterium]